MNNKSMMVLVTWIGAISLLVIGSIFGLDFIGMFLCVAIIFILGFLLFTISEDDNDQNVTEVDEIMSELKYEIAALHENINTIKRSIEY